MSENTEKNDNKQFIDRLRAAYDADAFDNLYNYEYQGLFGASKIYNTVANHECAEKYKQAKKDAATNSEAAEFVNKYENECIKQYAEYLKAYTTNEQERLQYTFDEEFHSKVTDKRDEQASQKDPIGRDAYWIEDEQGKLYLLEKNEKNSKFINYEKAVANNSSSKREYFEKYKEKLGISPSKVTSLDEFIESITPLNKEYIERNKKIQTEKMNEYVSKKDFQLTLSNEAIERLTGEKLSDNNEVSNTLSAKEVMDAHHDLSVEMYNKAHPLPIPEKSGLSDLGNKKQMTNLDADFIKTIKKIDNDISHANFRIHQNITISPEQWDKIEKEDCKDKEYLAKLEEEYYSKFEKDLPPFEDSELLPESKIVKEKDENGNEYAAYNLSHSEAKQALSQKTYNGTENDIDETKVYTAQNIRSTADKLLALHAKGKDDKAEQILPDFKEEYGIDITVKDKNISIPAESYLDLCDDISEQLNDNLNNNQTVIKSRENQYQSSSYQKLMSSNDNELSEDKTDLNLIMIAEAGSRAKAKITKNPQMLDGLSDTEKENIKFNINSLSTLKESLREEPYLKTDSDFQHRMNYVENLSDEELSKGLNQIEKSAEVQKSLNDEKNNSADLKNTLKAQAKETRGNVEKTNDDTEQLKAQMKEAAEEHKKPQEQAYQYSPDIPLNEQLQESAANSRPQNQTDTDKSAEINNSAELDKAREKVAQNNASKQKGSLESEENTNSQTKQSAQNEQNTDVQSNTNYIIQQQRQGGRN